MKRAQFGPHDWLSLPVPAGSSWLLVDTLEPETAYQFSVLAQNKLGTSSFSEVVTVNTLGRSSVGTREEGEGIQEVCGEKWPFALVTVSYLLGTEMISSSSF